MTLSNNLLAVWLALSDCCSESWRITRVHSRRPLGLPASIAGPPQQCCVSVLTCTAIRCHHDMQFQKNCLQISWLLHCPTFELAA